MSSVSVGALALVLLAGCSTRAPTQPPVPPKSDVVTIKLLAFNDFHGQLTTKRKVAGRPAGGAAVFASYLRAAQAGREDSTFIVHAGDLIGASPAESALAQDEPTIAFMNLLSNRHCTAAQRSNPNCNIVGTTGNHEFDEGPDELLRVLHGGLHKKGPFLHPQWQGATYPTVVANVEVIATKAPLLPRSVVKHAQGVSIGFIGAVVRKTPGIVPARASAPLRFADEATAVNQESAALRAQGIHALVLLIHEGGQQKPYQGDTHAGTVDGPEIIDIVNRLDDDIDVVVSGHAHQFTNAWLTTARGKRVLVTQAFAGGTAYADIDMRIDRKGGDIVDATARVITTFADAGPGLAPSADVTQLVAEAESAVAPIASRVVGEARADVTRKGDAAGQSPLGNLVADAQRAAVDAQIALMNPGGLRADLPAGLVTVGALFSVQPFANAIVRLQMTGKDIVQALEEQWQGGGGRLLEVSGLAYVWDHNEPPGSRVRSVSIAGQSLVPTALYTVAVNDYLSGGGDGFSAFKRARAARGEFVGPLDRDALAAHIEKLPRPFSYDRQKRVERR